MYNIKLIIYDLILLSKYVFLKKIKKAVFVYKMDEVIISRGDL